MVLFYDYIDMEPMDEESCVYTNATDDYFEIKEEQIDDDDGMFILFLRINHQNYL